MIGTTSLVSDIERQVGRTTAEAFGRLVDKLIAKRQRNDLREQYYDMKNLVRDLGIAVPPSLRSIEAAMEWPAKSVDLLSQRVRADGFVLPGGDVDDWGLYELAADNRLEMELGQAFTSAFIHSCSFLLTTQGAADLGEPEVLISAFTAKQATGEWDKARRGLSTGLVEMASDHEGASRYLFLTTRAAADIRRVDGRWHVADVFQHDLNRVPLEVLPYHPNLGRPFGQSRISRAVMAATDGAMRTVVRSEVGAEFYSTPQRYLLGADESSFTDAQGNRRNTWDLMIGRLLVLPDDDDATNPRAEVGQFAAITMQPHVEHFRMFANRAASAMSVPVSALGFVQDNPASAEAMDSAYKELELIAEGCGIAFAPAITRTMQTAVILRDGLSGTPDGLRRLGIRWRNPARPSMAAMADAVVKEVGAGVLPADSEVALERLGYDEETVRRIMDSKRRAAARTSLDVFGSAPVVTTDADAG